MPFVDTIHQRRDLRLHRSPEKAARFFAARTNASSSQEISSNGVLQSYNATFRRGALYSGKEMGRVWRVCNKTSGGKRYPSAHLSRNGIINIGC